LNHFKNGLTFSQDPEKTNEFLQALAKLIDTRTDTTAAVQRVLSGEKPGAKTSGGAPYSNNNNNNKSPSKNNNNSKGGKSNATKNGTGSRRGSIKEGDRNEKNKDRERLDRRLYFHRHKSYQTIPSSPATHRKPDHGVRSNCLQKQ